VAIGKGYRLATLHLWIDDLQNGKRWKYRYPIINGIAEGALEVSKNLKPGNYAFNFLGSDDYLQVKGRVKKVKINTAFNTATQKVDTILVEDQKGPINQNILYTLMNSNEILFDSILNLNDDGNFKLPPIIFGDNANLIFNPPKGKGTFMIDLETPLDSAFTPFHAQTVFVTVNAVAVGTAQVQVQKPADTLAYSFALADPFSQAETLQEIVIKGKSRIQNYEDEYVSKQFQNKLDGKTFSGLDNDEITRTNNLYTFLQSNVPGLIIRTSGVTRTATWRGDQVTFFLDEIRIDANSLNIAPSEIALIKTYPPPASMTSFVFGGAVAIYTKRGNYANGNGPRYVFPVIGYVHGDFFEEV
jgi:hypothetical protein